MTPVAAVVGGASGLGAAAARALAEEGFAVAVLDRDGERAEAIAAELGRDARALAVDVSDDDAVAAAFDACASRGELRALVCSAGIGWAERILGRDGPHDPAAFARVIGINLIGTFTVLRHASRLMAANQAGADGQRGVCVLTSSIAAEDGQAGQAAYSASKAAVTGLVLPAARDLADAGIRVCAIAPGVFRTPLLEALPEKAQRSLATQIPAPPRLGEPAEFGSLVLEIVRNPYLNGSVFRLDGGLRMPYQPRRQEG